MISLVKDWVVDPLGLLLLWLLGLSLMALILKRRRRSRRVAASSSAGRWLRRGVFAVLGLAGFAVVAGPAIVNPVLASLEHQEPATECAASTRIVVLGGGASALAQDVSEFSAMSSATLARTQGAIELAMADPTASVVTVGGGLGAVTEADLMAELIEQFGIDPARVQRERTSSNTAENATRVRELLGSDGGPGEESIRLVTSAAHMARAAGVFRASGFEVCPYPVDHLALADVPWWALWPQTTAMVKFDKWLHETIALQLYRWRGDIRPSS